MQMLRNASLFALLTLLLDFVPLVMAVVYVFRPTERHLSLMRPLSLAGLFSGLAGGTLGFMNGLVGIGSRRDSFVDVYRVVAIGAAESLVPTFLSFACLTVAWLLVTAGMARMRPEPE
jgi:hypothetical protein